MAHLSEATLKRLDAAAMNAVALALMGVFLARLMIMPMVAEARDGQMVICGAAGMTVISLDASDNPEPIADPPSCAEHCVLTVEFQPNTPTAATDFRPWLITDDHFHSADLRVLSHRAFRSRAPPFFI
ncbi:MAG: hypothetical protein AAGC81_06415 [Pseudomonadota bacterium]